VFERFTTQARSVVTLAQGEARELGHPNLGTHLLLLGILGPGRRRETHDEPGEEHGTNVTDEKSHRSQYASKPACPA